MGISIQILKKMNKIFFLTVVLTLSLSVSCVYPPWKFTSAQEKAIKKLMKTSQDAVGGKCQVGWHKMSTWSLKQWGFSDGCVRNDANCQNFDMLSGHCKKCTYWSNSQADTTFGNWCGVTWYAWLFFYMWLLFEILVLVLVVLACKMCCSQNRKYKKQTNVSAEEVHVEMVSQSECSYEEDSHSREYYSNPYQH